MDVTATAFKDYEENDREEGDDIYHTVLGFLNSKNFVIEHIARVDILDVMKTKRALVLIMRLNEFGKLSEHCPEFISFVRLAVTKTYKQKIMSAVVIKGGGHIKKMIDLFKSMEPYNHELQIKLKKYDDTIKKADDTIKQLRLDLKEFRSMRRNINKKMKKNLEKPPEYEDERPPGF
jgi:hypothetical protein